MEKQYKYLGKLFETDPAVDKANEEYQKAIKRLLAKEITLAECMVYKEKVTKACNESTLGWKIRKS